MAITSSANPGAASANRPEVSMKPELRNKIDELIKLDAQYRQEQKERYPDGITFGLPSGDAMVEDILYGDKHPVVAAIESLSVEELAYVTALAWFGRGDGVAEQGATFASVLQYAQERTDANSVTYVHGMPLSKYLPKGLKRLGID